MAYTRNVDSYPLYIFRAFEDVLSNGTKVRIPCDNSRQARTLRFKFYGLRYAIMESDNPPHPLKDQAVKLQFVVEDNNLVVQHIEDDPKNRDMDARVIEAIESAHRRPRGE